MIPRVRLAAILVAALSGATFAQDIRVTNMASVARKQWVDVTLPAADAALLPILCRLDPHGWPVVKGSAVGVHSTLFHVLCELGPDATITGTLVGISVNPGSVPSHAMTDWVADDTLGLIPVPALLDRSGVERRMVNPTLVQVESATPARKVFRLRGRMAGTPLVCESFIYVYSHQDAVKIEVTFTHSDPSTSALSYDFDFLWLEVGEYPVIDFRHRLGMVTPVRQTAATGHPSYNKWVQLLSGPRTMGRGEQIHVTGWLLSQPSTGRATHTFRYSAGPMNVGITEGERMTTLLAVSQAPAVAVSTGWQGKWLGFGMTPEIPYNVSNGGWTAADQSASGFRSLLASPADLYTQRPRGLNRGAASTGAQEDFGATKGTYAVSVGDPRLIHELAYSVHGEVFLRPYHYRELNGSPLLQRNHPTLQTWSQFVNCRTTGETLGFVCPLPYSWPSNGWSAYDDQHRSHNNFNALLALTGDWSLRATMKDLAEIDQTQVPNRMDSPRAEGRLFMAWANMWLLLDDPQDRQNLLAHMGDRMIAIQNLWRGGGFVGNPSKPVRALAVGSDPTFLEPNGSRVPAIIVWEHGIAVMGLYAGYRVTGDTRMRDIAAEVSKVIVNHCFFQDSGTWTACTAVRYLEGTQEGDALPASSYYLGSPDIHIGVSFLTWIMPSVLICRELHRNDGALVARCNAILQGLVPNGPSSWSRAEWWAVLPR